MARSTYSIPATLDRTILDHELSLSSKNLKIRPLPMKVILFYLVSAIGLFWLLTGTPLKGANPGFLIGIGIWWIAATIYFGAYSKTKEMRFNQIIPLMDYLPKRSRRVLTRSDSKPAAFYAIVGISDIDPDSAMITYADGTVGQAYSVVGSASWLLFDEDRDRILDRNDRFYRKIDPGVEWIYVTTKEPQRVYSQVASLERRNRALDLEARDPDLVALMNDQLTVLQRYVGQEFFSIHQYLFLRAPNKETLRAAHNLLDSEARDSDLVFKQIMTLTSDETLDLLKTVYTSA